MFRKVRKGIKNFVNEKDQSCKKILSSDKNRKIIGIIVASIGAGLFASGCIH